MSSSTAFDLLGDHLQQRLQGLALLGVALPVDRRQQVVEAVFPDVLGTAHDFFSFRIRVSATSGVR